MSQLFSDIWMNDLKNAWNNVPTVYAPLEKANFSANIAYGFKGEDKLRGVIAIISGKVTNGSANAGESLDWDFRASPENWQLWLKEGFGLQPPRPSCCNEEAPVSRG